MKSLHLDGASVFLFQHHDGSTCTDLTVHVHPEDAATLHTELQKFGLHAKATRPVKLGGEVTKYTSNLPETPSKADRIEVIVFSDDNHDRNFAYHPDVVNA